MTRFLLIIFLLINFSTFGQKKLNGTYAWSTDSGGERFNFYKDGTFKYSDSDCLYYIKGKGNYTIDKKTLKLDFTGYEPSESSFTVENKICDNPAIVTINFQTSYRGTKDKISFADIKLLSKRSQNQIGYTHTDINGMGALSLPAIYGDSTVIIIIDYFRKLKNPLLEFKPDSCKEIKIELVEEWNSHNQIIPSGTVWEYTIQKSSSKELIIHGNKSLSNPDGYITTLTKRNKENE